MDSTKRIQLLSNTEVDELYARPEFMPTNSDFISRSIHRNVMRLGSSAIQKLAIYFILQLGYFKAKQQFSTSLEDVKDDVKFIVGTYYSESVLDVAHRAFIP